MALTRACALRLTASGGMRYAFLCTRLQRHAPSSSPGEGGKAMKPMNLEFTRIEHDTFKIVGSKMIYTDPYKVTSRDEADIVLISHQHFDHLSLEDLNRVIYPGSTILASPLCKDGLKGVKVKDLHYMDPGGKH